MKKNYFLLMCSILLVTSTYGQTYQTWRSDSGTGDNSWQNASNWWNFPGASAIVFGQQEWDNNHLPTQVNSADISTWRFLFKSGASDAHTFTGNQISFFDFSGQDPQIINQSAGTHTINNNINGDPDAADPLTFVIDNTGGLTLGGTINNQGWIDVNGTTGSATNVTFNGVISGTGGVTKENVNITLNFNADNTYSGATNVNNGSLVLSASLANSDVSVGASGTLQISENATLSSLTIAAGGTVIVDAGKSLTITNNLVNNGSSFTINNGGSVIVNGTSTGNVTYNRTLGSTNWYLMSAPVSGVTFNDSFVSTNNIAVSTTPGFTDNRGVASYTTTSNTWLYLQSGGSMSADSGTGYSVKQDVAGTVSFTGTINTSDVDADIAFTGDGFNLVGNPFASHINSKTFLDANSNLDQTQLWVWNQASGMYEVKTNASTFMLAPSQGFFVKANSGTQVTFAASNQEITGGTFQKSSTTTELQLFMSDGNRNRFAKIYYSNAASKGFDYGWEGEVFGGIPNSLDVYTNLVEENQGKKYQIQSLPNSDFESMVIPVGITADAGELTFSAEGMNLPSELKIFLEDRDNGTFTRLDELNSTYSVTLSEKTEGVGRFYLHTKSAALSTDSISLGNVSIFTTNSSTLRVVGLSRGSSTVKLFNVLGKQVLETSFTSNGVYDISLPKLSTGVYIVQLENESGKMNKKIVLE